MRFPFGRGARQREIDSLRQRIAELQDEVTAIEESLAARAPDADATDAYKSVQALRESMRREEIATLREEMRGLEARLETLTADRRPSRAATDEPKHAAGNLEAVVVSGDGAQAEAAGPPSEGLAEAASEVEAAAPPGPARTALTGHGLPSERAIIEPPFPPHPSLPVGARLTGEEGAEAATDQEPVLAANETDAQSAEAPAEPEAAAPQAVVAGEAAETATMVQEEQTEAVAPVEATSSPAEEGMPAEAVAAEHEVPEAFPAEAEPVEEPAAVAAESEAVDLVAVADGAGPRTDDEAEAVPEGDGQAIEEAVEAAAAARAGRPSRATVALIFLVTVAILAIAAVVALESGLINTGIGPVAAPTALPTRQPATTAPPTVRPATVPSPIPSPTSLVTAALGEEALLEGASVGLLFGFELREQGDRLG